MSTKKNFYPGHKATVVVTPAPKPVTASERLTADLAKAQKAKGSRLNKSEVAAITARHERREARHTKAQSIGNKVSRAATVTGKVTAKAGIGAWNSAFRGIRLAVEGARLAPAAVAGAVVVAATSIKEEYDRAL